jgi:hypothetical protein
MAQTVVAPAAGESLANYRSKIEDAFNAILSGLSGTTRPSNLQTGGIWFNTSTNKPLLYNGITDVSLGGLVAVNTAEVGNTGTGEDDLQSITIPASTLWANGQYLEVTAILQFAANANAKTAKLYFGGTLIFQCPDFQTGAVQITAKIYRTGAATQKVFATATFDMNVSGLIDLRATYTATTQTLANALVIKTTGEATANDDIVSQVLSAKLVF